MATHTVPVVHRVHRARSAARRFLLAKAKPPLKDLFQSVAAHAVAPAKLDAAAGGRLASWPHCEGGQSHARREATKTLNVGKQRKEGICGIHGGA